jgi:hypothetical protein
MVFQSIWGCLVVLVKYGVGEATMRCIGGEVWGETRQKRRDEQYYLRPVIFAVVRR